MKIDATFVYSPLVATFIVEVGGLLFRLKGVEEFLGNGADDYLGRFLLQQRPNLLDDCINGLKLLLSLAQSG